MPLRKRMIKDEAIPQVKAQQIQHPKHSERFSKKRNERFSVQAVRTPKSPKQLRD